MTTPRTERGAQLDPAGAASLPGPATHLPPPPPPSTGRTAEDAEALDRATVAGRVFAHTAGIDVAVDDTRFRMRVARVGQRVIDLHDPTTGRHQATLTETEKGAAWLVHSQGIAGDAYTQRRSFAAAVWAGEIAGDIVATPLPDAAADKGPELPEVDEVSAGPRERTATLEDMRRAWPDASDEQLRAAAAAVDRAGGSITVTTG